MIGLIRSKEQCCCLCTQLRASPSCLLCTYRIEMTLNWVNLPAFYFAKIAERGTVE